MRRTSGFTLVEVVMALLVLEAAVLAVFGTLVVASRTTAEAERVERAVADVEGVLDSLAGVSDAGSGSRVSAHGTISWEVSGDGRAVVRVVTPTGGVLVEAATWLAR